MKCLNGSIDGGCGFELDSNFDSSIVENEETITKDSLISFPDYCKNCIRIPVADDPQESARFIELLSQTNVLERINNSIKNRER